eukprot:695150-Prymnesium_polylepis.1
MFSRNPRFPVCRLIDGSSSRGSKSSTWSTCSSSGALLFGPPCPTRSRQPAYSEPQHPPQIAQISPVHPFSPSSTGATQGDGDSLRRSIDEFSSEVALQTEEGYSRHQ